MILAVAQVNPRLGDLSFNLQAHLSMVEKAVEANARLLLFPELSLTGYALRDLTAECALSSDDPFLKPLLEASKRIPLAFGFVERAADEGLYNSLAFCAEGRVLHIHRKVYLSTYGMFEEGRFFTAGKNFVAFDSPLGRVGMLICSDVWHAPAPMLLAHQGARLLLVAAASPLRGLRPRPESIPGWMESPGGDNGRVWYTLLSAHAKMQTLPILFANRVGFDDGIGFWGGSSLWAPDGLRPHGLDHADEELLIAPLDIEDLRSQRTLAPLLKNESLGLLEEELRRIRNKGVDGP
jgi:predicted amidohydrolase